MGGIAHLFLAMYCSQGKRMERATMMTTETVFVVVTSIFSPATATMTIVLL